MKKPKSRATAEAIQTNVDLSEWQVAEIKAALQEADAGDFATDQEVEAVLRKWSRTAVSRT